MEKKMNYFFLYLKNHNYSEYTIRDYKYELELFFQYLKKNNIEFNQIRRVIIIDYLILYNACETTTKRKKISVLKTFFNFLVKNKLIEINPCNCIDNSKNKKKLPNIVKKKDIQKILITEVNDKNEQNEIFIRNLAILTIMYGSGLRISEVSSLKVKDIYFENKLIRVIGKGNKERIVPISSYCIQIINKYLVLNKRENIYLYQDEYLFLNYKRKKLSKRYIQIIIKNFCKKYSLSKFTPHDLRHTFATILLESGMKLTSVQKLLGHNSLRTTQVYTNISQDFIKKKFSKVNLLEKKEKK